ncbi:type VI secretion system tube protein Hcp [Ideonella sp. A 288]|uniref:Hcp family type VI secretion system effector n=1 Tax=Ideonella sp. A 288 TaxID=1962181 RepID=UPI000B4A9344|nr:type VI secretion system tube protein Hcp [Ideonella sp. A 288]
MATDTHIKFDGVDGEATHADHKGEIEILSWTWGVSNVNAGGTSGGGSGKGKATPNDFNFLHTYDKASPILAKKCAQGVHFPSVVLTARKSGEGQKDFLKITLKEVFITSVQPSGSSQGDIVESVSMSYASVDFAYKAQDDKGALGGDVKFGWNVKTTTIT